MVATIANSADVTLVDVKVAIAQTTPAGPTTRSAVVPHGRGVKRASKPRAHAAHRSTAAARAGPTGQPSNASLNAVPVATGSNAHTTRALHNHIAGLRVTCSLRAPTFPRRILRILMAGTGLGAGMATAIGSLPHRDAARGRRARVALHPRRAGRTATSAPHTARRGGRAVGNRDSRRHRARRRDASSSYPN